MLGRNKKDSGLKEKLQQAKNMLNKYRKNLKDFGLKHLNLDKINKGKLYFKKYAMTAAAIGACGITVLTINSVSNREPVLELYYNGQRVGYVESNDIYRNSDGKIYIDVYVFGIYI